MISENNYKRMATEVLEIINLYPQSIKEKIPNKLVQELQRHRNSDLKVVLDKSKKLYEQELCDETLVMMYMIYRDYIAKPEERASFDKILGKFDEETRKKYDPSNLFKNNGSKDEKGNNQQESRE